MKTNSIIRNLIITALFLFAATGSAFAIPIGVSGLSNPGSVVCAKDINGSLWCDKANSGGAFNITSGQTAPTNNWGPFPLHGLLTMFNTACPQNAVVVDRDGPDFAGGAWLDVSCKDCVAPPAGMVAWYPLDETGGTRASELIQATASITNPLATSSPIDGKYYGSPYHLTGAYGWVGTAAQFDGVDDYVETSHHSSLNFGTGDFTIDCWVKIDHPNDAKNGVRVLVEKREMVTASDIRGYSLYLYKGRVSLQLADGNYTNFGSSLIVPADGLWHFVAVTVDRNNPNGGKFYRSLGTQGNFTIETEPFDPTKRQGSLDNGRPLRIGSTTLGGPGSLFKGGIDEVELFNRALADWEITPIIEAGRYGKCKPCAICQ